MKEWKRAVVAGSLGAGAVLALTGRRGAAVACVGIGVAMLAAEYPDEFDNVCEQAQDYISRGAQVVNLLTRILERFSEPRELVEDDPTYAS